MAFQHTSHPSGLMCPPSHFEYGIAFLTPEVMFDTDFFRTAVHTLALLCTL